MSLGYHVMMRLASGQVIASTTAQRRELATVLLSQGRELELLAFFVADNHIHALLMCSRAQATEFARRVELSCQAHRHFGVPFSHCHLKAVRDQAHLENTFHYILRQELRHNTDLDPLREGSIVLDLLGLRVLGLYAVATVRAAIPRATRNDLLAHLGDVDLDQPIVHWSHLEQAAASAFGLADLRARTSRTARALAAAAALAGGQIGATETAALLGRSRSTLWRLQRSIEPSALAIEAVRKQLALRQQVLGGRSDVRDPGLQPWS